MASQYDGDTRPWRVGRRWQAETEALSGWRHQQHVAGADDDGFGIELIEGKFAIRLARQGIEGRRAYVEEDIQEGLEVVSLAENAIEFAVRAVGDFLQQEFTRGLIPMGALDCSSAPPTKAFRENSVRTIRKTEYFLDATWG